MSTSFVTNRYVIASTLVLVGACIGVNPDWERPDGRTSADSGGSTAQAAHDGSTNDALPGGSTLLNDASTGDADVDVNACLEQGLASCEADGVHVCADLGDDVAHCGACFVDCRALGALRCESGVCVCEGGDWWRVCDGRCTNTKDDPSACGPGCVDCRATLGPDVRCHNGTCESDRRGDDDDDD